MYQFPIRAMHPRRAGHWLVRIAASAYGVLATLWLVSAGTTTVYAAAPATVVSSIPLSVGGDVPGNVALALSVEFPTAVSVAHQGDFTPGNAYVGYFDHNKCYRYVQQAAAGSNDSSDTGNNVSYFTPVGSATADFKCTGAGLTDAWSGSFMNWLTMQAIDPFRQAMTGGYRRVDTSSGMTILERAWSPTNGDSAGNQGSDNNFPPIPCNSVSNCAGGVDADVLKRRRSPSSTAITEHTPLTFTSLKVSVRTRGNQILFSNGTTGTVPGPPTLNTTTPSNNAPPTNATGGTHYSQSLTLATGTVYRFYARVRVCDNVSAGAGPLESNCKRYGSYYKPEGLIQDYSRRLRFSALGYLNDPTDDPRDGGVLRARQKFVGPNVIVPGSLPTDNDNKEWDPATGVFVSNPDSDDATNTTNSYSGVAVSSSGVINYLNKFGQSQHVYKRRDPVAELYYAALRYLKGQGNVSAWMPTTGDANRARLIDGFPVIGTWDDPIEYACQRNYIVGIGDTNSSWDRNVPGPTTDATTGHAPSGGKPAAVTSDDTVDADAMRTKVRALNSNLSGASGDASDLIAGLAYHAATQDIRIDMDDLANQPRGQNVRTYWLDVLEFAQYTANNQYYLAAKYGGLKIPKGVTFNPLTATAADIPESWWRTNTDTVGGQPRPDNYFTVADPDAMVRGLRKTFISIVNDQVGSASSLAANSTRLDDDTVTYQAQFRSGVWSGELFAYPVNELTGELSATPVWNATEDMLTAGPGAAMTWSTRNIKVNNSGSLVNFTTTAGGLSATQKAFFGANAAAQTNVVNYLRGERSNEDSQDNGFLRTRENILGDIVNSTPLFIGAPNAALHAGKAYAGGADYADWVSDISRTPVLYVGANDGMLHAFNAATGREVFAFVPNAVIESGLASYADPLYEHKFFVDGETAAADIYDTSDSSWKTVLVGSLGRGGPGLFALDVTDPTAPELLWELDGGDIPVLGKNIGRPVIAQVASGDWRLLLGNGPDSGDGAHLISITLGGAANGTVTTYAADTSTDNGLTSLLVRDSNADSFADIAYAGDLEGSMWKFSSLGGTISSVKLFAAVSSDGDPQPITAAPMVARDPDTGYLWLFFGTGRYLHEDDINNKDVQSWYGIIDSGALVARGDLVDRDILVETTVSSIPARVIEEGSAADLAGKKGWYIDLVSPTADPADGIKGERMVVQNRFQGQALIGTTRIPEYVDPCDPGGTGFVMAISPFTGARLSSTFFDMNGDGISNDSDKYCDGVVCVPLSGIGFASSPNNPIFIENVMQVGLDSGETEAIKTFGSSVEAARMSWRELFNNN